MGIVVQGHGSVVVVNPSRMNLRWYIVCLILNKIIRQTEKS